MQEAEQKMKILFLCAGNSCRSQTAEEAIGCYRRVRNEIRAFVEKMPKILKK